MAKNSVRAAKPKTPLGVNIGLYEIDSHEELVEVDGDGVFVGVRLDHDQFGLDYDAVLDLENGILHIGCQSMTIEKWRKAAKRVAKNESIPDGDFDAYTRIADVAEKLFAKTASISAKIAAAREQLKEQAVAFAEKLAVAAEVQPTAEAGEED